MGVFLRIVRICLILSCLLFHNSGFACVGARPMGMGGAFVAVADDSNAVYWNQAGLSQIRHKEVTYTRTVPEEARNTYNYDDFIACVLPLEENLGTIGLWYVNSGFKGTTEEIDNWYVLSYGKEIIKDFSMGIELKYQDYEIRNNSASGKDELKQLSLSSLWKKDKLSIGILVQNINHAGRTILNSEYNYITNVRPGIAFKPDDKTIFALEIYDLLGETKNYNPDVSRDIRMGFERWVNNQTAVRAGIYHLGNRDGQMEAYTFGLSYKPKNSFLPEECRFDYALMYWTNTGANVSKILTQIGIAISF